MYLFSETSLKPGHNLFSNYTHPHAGANAIGKRPRRKGYVSDNTLHPSNGKPG